MSIISRIQRSPIWHIKERLQFTGWLQYLLNLVAALVCLLPALVGWWAGAGSSPFVRLPGALGGLLLLVLVFDLVTVKLGLRPAEPLPRRQDARNAFELMRERRSCRAFQARDLRPEDRAELMDAVRAQSQPERRLGQRPIRFEYVSAPLTVWPVVGAHEFLVAIAPLEYDRFAVIDVGRCLQKVVLQATRMGLASCWIGPGADHLSIERHLGARFDPARDHIVCVCALGYASRFIPLSVRVMSFAMRRRLPLEALVFADPRFEAPLDLAAPPFDRFGRCFEACRWAPSSYNGQTTRAVAVAQGAAETDAIRLDFYATTHSRYYAPVALGIWCANWETGCAALGIPGHFAVLSPEARDAQAAPELPRYDLSWLEDGD